jgi:exo-beta-1,3-glucanase (GH17 family)
MKRRKSIAQSAVPTGAGKNFLDWFKRTILFFNMLPSGRVITIQPRKEITTFYSTVWRSPLIGIAVLLVLNMLLSGCSSDKPATTITSALASPTPDPRFVCKQPKSGGELPLAGLAYGPYHSGQDPNYKIFPSNEEVDTDIPTLKCLTNNIRIYSSLGPAKRIVQDAEKAQMKVNLGIWLGKDATTNKDEIDAAKTLASTSKAVNAVTVGNEVLLRGDLPVEGVRDAIQQVRAKLGHSVRITMAEVYDVWKDHLDLAEDLDFVTVHIHPFWRKVSLDAAIPSLAANYNDLKNRIKARFPSKNIPVVIGETGWPSDGPPQGAAKPSAVNQARYFKEFIDWTKKQQEKIDYFFFDAFDEEWKVNEAGVGTHWGLYQQDGVVKPELSSMIPRAAPETLKQRSYRNMSVRGLSSGLDIGLDTSGQQRAWLTNHNL